MSPRVRDLGRDMLGWLVVMLAVSNSWARAVQGVLDDRLDHFWLHAGSSGFVFLFALGVEKTKRFLEESS